MQRLRFEGTYEADSVSLQPIGGKRRAGFNQLQIGLAAEQRLTGGPEEAAAACTIEHARIVILIADRDSAIYVAMIGLQADRVFVWLWLPHARRALIGVYDGVSHHARDIALHQRPEVISPARRGALGEKHPALIVEGDFRNFGRSGRWRNCDLHLWIVAEGSVGVELHRPDVRTGGDCVIEPAGMDAETVYTPLGRSVIPRRGVAWIELLILNVKALRGIERQSGKVLDRPTLDAVIVMVEISAGRIEAVDHPRLAIGHIEIARLGIEYDAAERRSGIGHAVQRNVGEKRDSAGLPVDLPNRARPTAAVRGSPKTLHECGATRAAFQSLRVLRIAALRNDRQSIDGGRRGIDIWGPGIVQGDTEDLTDLFRRNGVGSRRIDDLSCCRSAHQLQIQNA